VIFFILLSLDIFSQNIFSKYYPNGISPPYFLSNGMSYQFQIFDDNGISSMSVLKNDINGNVVWNRTYYDTSAQFGMAGNQFKALPDGGFAFLGSRSDNTNSSRFLFRGDSLGNILWTKIICSIYYTPVKIEITYDNGFIIPINQWPESYILSIDSSGNLNYYKHISPQFFSIDDIKLLPDSNFLLLGNQSQFEEKISVAKIDKNANFLWSVGIGDSLAHYPETHASDMAITWDNGFVIFGWFELAGSPFYKSILKFNSNGALQWTKVLFTPTNGVSEPGNYVIQSSDSGLIISYENQPYGNTFLVKTDFAGNVLWSKSYKGYVRSLIEEQDGGFNLTGFSNLFPGTFNFKTDSAGNASCEDSSVVVVDSLVVLPQFGITYSDTNLVLSITDLPILDSLSTLLVYDYCQFVKTENIILKNEFAIFPNPASSTFTIRFDSQFQNADLEIFNLLGEEVYHVEYKSNLTVDCEHLPPGLYFVKLQTEKGSAVEKLVIQK